MSSLAQSVLSYIGAKDHVLMRRVHRWRPPRWVRLWMLLATRAGDGWLWAALGLVLLAAGGDAGLRTTGEGAMAAACGVAVFVWLKTLTGRKRPCALEPHCWASLVPPDHFSFPSGHTITAFAVCTPVALHYPDAVPSLAICALSVAASRVSLGMHFLSDVIAGAALGILLGAGAHSLL